MTKKIKTAKSIIAQLDALCTNVLDNTKKATETLDKSDKKLLAFMLEFTKEARTKYMEVIKKYCAITGQEKLTLCIQNVATSYNLYLELSVDRYDAIVVELVWEERYKKDILLELRYNSTWRTNDPSVFGRRHSSEVYREKLVYMVQYIKSGRFEQDFVQCVSQACKDRLAMNAIMTATATVNNRI